MSDIPRANSVGRRVVVTGMAGAGKSTFSRALSAKTGLPVIVLDVHFWLPGWTEPTEAEWREKQKRVLAGDDWIADGNYHATLDLLPRHARSSTRASRHGRVPRHTVVDLRMARARARGSNAPG